MPGACSSVIATWMPRIVNDAEQPVAELLVPQTLADSRGGGQDRAGRRQDSVLGAPVRKNPPHPPQASRK